MKRILFLIILSVGFIIVSCDEPQALEDSEFSYNPFSFKKDTVNIIQTTSNGRSSIDWGSHLRAWVGETKYYKSGFDIRFVLPDTSLDLSTADSILLYMRHTISFAEDGNDTLVSTYMNTAFSRTDGQTIDILNSAYGLPLGIDTMNVKENNSYWTYKLPAGTITSTDSSVGLGVFPAEAGVLSSIYGSGSSIGPSLLFYFHEPDSAGNDSATAVTVLSDTLHMYLEEQPGVFDRTNYQYLSQLSRDSIDIQLDISSLAPTGDTLVHIISSSLLPAIIDSASSLYISGSLDSLQTYYLQVLDYDASVAASITLGVDEDPSNEIGSIIQTAINDGRPTIDLVVRSNHIGYDPGFIAVSNDPAESAIYVYSSKVVRP